MGLLEVYRYGESGFSPQVMGQDWQVAVLNYSDDQKPENIKKIDIHFKTDEVFILSKGKAVLITGELIENELRFEFMPMKAGEIYNVPGGVWHNIAMEQGTQVFIVENRDTHLGDFEFHYFSQREQAVLNNELSNFFTEGC